MDIDILHLIEGAKQAQGLTVIIDVFRAFSTACYVVQNGAGEIIPVGDIDLAYKLRDENPDYILMGERKGKMLPGFDYGNSPTEIQTVDFSGKTVIQTTSAGTQGFANARNADELITGSFVNGRPEGAGPGSRGAVRLFSGARSGAVRPVVSGHADRHRGRVGGHVGGQSRADSLRQRL